MNMSKRTIASLLILPLAISGAWMMAAFTAPKALEFRADVYKSDGKELPYRYAAPEKIKSGKKYPLVIFFHGVGESGTNNDAQLKHPMNGFFTPKSMHKYEYFALAPQVPLGSKWVDVSWIAPSHHQPDHPAEYMAMAMDLLDSFIKTNPVDTNRLYITGVSMGGYATWDVITRYPGKFAAAAPICGGGDEHQAYKALKTAIWAFHGAKDQVVKVSRSRNMVDTLRKTGATIQYTEYPKVGHNAWDSAYKEPKLLPWMFAQRRKDE